MAIRWLAGLALLATLLFPIPVGAQEGTGAIEGRVVKDEKGVVGVTVILQETRATKITDTQGRFKFDRVPAGRYTLVFSLDKNTSTLKIDVADGKTSTASLEVDWEVSFFERVTVYSASRKPEKIVDAPAAVAVIPAEEIAQEASHGQLPKVLEFTPGAEVTQSGTYDFNFNTRGFNSSVNRRVAVYVDGRDTAAPFLGAQEWSALSYPLDDLANLEFIRGPSAALYGANASAGVINMITKTPKDSPGGTVRLSAGELETTNLDLRWGDAIGKDWYVKVIGGLRNSGQGRGPQRTRFTVSRDEEVEYSRPCSSEELIDPDLRASPCLPQERIALVDSVNQIYTGAVRFDKYWGGDDKVFTVEAGTGNIGGPVFQTGIGRIATIESRRPFARIAHSRPHLNVFAYYSGRDAEQQSLQSAAEIFTDSEKYSVEAQTFWDLGGDDRGRIVFGGAYIREEIDTLNPKTGQQSLIVEPVDVNRSAVFAQFDWRFTDKIKLVAAGRIDESDLHETQFSPKAAVVYNLTPNQTLRFTYNEAFQVANYSEFFLNAQVTTSTGFDILRGLCEQAVPGTDMDEESCGFLRELPVFAVGNEDLELEETQSAEVGYSAIFGNKAFLTVDYYRSQNENFITDLLSQVGTPLGPTIDMPLNPLVPSWVAPPEFNDYFANPNPGPTDPSLADQLSGAFDTLGALNGVQVSNGPRGDTVIVARSYTNFGDVDTQGVDLGLNYYFDNDLQLQFSYSWFDFDPKVDTTGLDPDEVADLEGLLLPNTPEHKFSLGLSYSGRDWSAGIAGRWVDDFVWGAGIFGPGPVPSYSVMDLNANYDISEKWSFGVNVSNLLDSGDYQSFGGDLLGRRALTYLVYKWQ